MRWKRVSDAAPARTLPSTRVIVVALLGNLGVALAKFVAAQASGSSAMLTEAIHSVIDTGDEILLLAGQYRGRRPADATHPLGYGMEVYFWSFVVALTIFLLGGMVSITQGVQKLAAAQPVTSPWVNFGVLAIAAVLEGASLRVGLREYRRQVRGREVGVWTFIVRSKDPGIFSVLLEDSAALVGLGLAALGVYGSAFLHLWWADGAASIAIGLVLVAVAVVLANETRSLIAGEAVSPGTLEKLSAALDRAELNIRELVTLQLGPGNILVLLTVAFDEPLVGRELSTRVARITRKLQTADARVSHVFVRVHDGPADALPQR